MRRYLVIFLILLFPLNVLALSASMAQHGSAHEPAVVLADSGAEPDARGDVDPDEPPSAPDLHDLLNQERALRLAGSAAGAPAPPAPSCLGRAVPPPVKPPRLA